MNVWTCWTIWCVFLLAIGVFMMYRLWKNPDEYYRKHRETFFGAFPFDRWGLRDNPKRATQVAKILSVVMWLLLAMLMLFGLLSIMR